jgi:hypothetical protein
MVLVDVQRPIGTVHQFRIDYDGLEGGGWHYYLDGVPVIVPLCTDAAHCNYSGNTEPGPFLNASLNGRPHVATYWSAPGNNIAVQGHLSYITVQQLNKISVPAENVSAWSSYPGYPPSNVVDGSSGTSWNAGGPPVRWIELDLGAVKSIKRIRLLTNQDIPGSTTHKVLIGNSPSPATVVSTIAGYTSDSMWLDVDFPSGPWSGRYVRIQTYAGPTWVSWREIEVYE